METNLSADKPVNLKEEDKFQRYNFSRRIAKTIFERESEDCIVLGIYGAWGEGKTSVLNFIETELQLQENAIIIKFNPWRYNDENSLLYQFFQKLAIELNIKLKNKKEKAGEFLHKYGKLLNIEIPFIGNIGESAKTVGEILAEVDIETLKVRIGDILKENKSKVIVFIDDIDRLDKNEIHSIFRLVKLTADFANTVYILSFDEAMVASAIGERFGEGNQKAGQNFLEKIIQVPLKIPTAQPDALKAFCFELVDKSIISNHLEITKEEAQRFVNSFISNVLPKLDTPRLAVRYGNTLSFSLPLLFGEVNTVDLMLIEAVKIFFPNFYDFIKLNPHYFIGSYSSSNSLESIDEKIKEIKEHFDNMGKGLTKKQFSGIKSLLQELFPNLNSAFRGSYHFGGTEEDWFKNKRIASAKYFNRYFSYAVIKGETSDVALKEFIAKIPSQEGLEVVEEIKRLVAQSSPENFLLKIRIYEEEYSWDIATKLAISLSKCSEIFPLSNNDFFSLGFGSPNSQAAIFIYQLLKKHEDIDQKLALSKTLMSEAQPFDFAYVLNSWFRSGDTEEKKLFSQEQILDLGETLLNRAKEEAKVIPLFEKYPEHSTYLYAVWADKDKEGLYKYFEDLFTEFPEKCLKLLNAFTPTMRSSAYANPYKSNFSKEQYEYFIQIFDKDLIKKFILLNFNEEDINREKPTWEQHRGDYQSDINIVRQFYHWDQPPVVI